MTNKKDTIRELADELSQVSSPLVSLKTALGIAGGSLVAAMIFVAGLFNDPSSLSANILDNTGVKHALPVTVDGGTIAFLALLGAIFFTIFVLYILAKIEGQKHGEPYHNNSKAFAYRYFPSVFIMEALTMLYVVLTVLAAILFIAQLRYGVITKEASENFLILSSTAFAVLGGGLAQLYYFLNKVQPQDLTEGVHSSSKHASEFDINRTFRFLSFPFLSAGMGVLAYTLIKGTGSLLNMDGFENPSYWFLMFIALTSGYFCDLFILIFHRIVKRFENKIFNGDSASPQVS